MAARYAGRSPSSCLAAAHEDELPSHCESLTQIVHQSPVQASANVPAAVLSFSDTISPNPDLPRTPAKVSTGHLSCQLGLL